MPESVLIIPHEDPTLAGQTQALPSDLTRTQWGRLKPLLPDTKPGGRTREGDLREILNGIFSICCGGCGWRMMPKNLPPWSTCYDYFRKWRNAGVWSKDNDTLRTQVRHQDGRKKSPSRGIIDSQSVKATEQGGPRGKDAHKKVGGRKRHLVVDTPGMVVSAVVHSAGIQDRDKNYEGPEESSESWIDVAMTHLMLRRLETT